LRQHQYCGQTFSSTVLFFARKHVSSRFQLEYWDQSIRYSVSLQAQQQQQEEEISWDEIPSSENQKSKLQVSNDKSLNQIPFVWLYAQDTHETTLNDLLHKILTDTTIPEKYQNTQTFNSLLQYITIQEVTSLCLKSRTTHFSRAESAEKILLYMLKQQETTKGIIPNTLTLNLALAAYRASGKDSCGISKHQRSIVFESTLSNAEMAYRLLKEWDEKLYSARSVSSRSDCVSYNTVIAAFGEIGDYKEAQIVFDDLHGRYFGNVKANRYKPNIMSYNCLLKAFAKAGQSKRAEELLRYMLSPNTCPQSSQRNSSVPSPTIHSYNSVLYAYSNSDNQQLASHQFLLEWLASSTGKKSKMLSKSKITSTDPDGSDCDDAIVFPNTCSYNIVLHSMTQAIRLQNRRRPVDKEKLKGYRSWSPRNSTYTYANDRRKRNNNNNKGNDKRVYPYIQNDVYGADTVAALATDPDFIVNRIQALFDSIPAKDGISYTSVIAAYCESACSFRTGGRKSYSFKIKTILDIIQNLVDRAYDDKLVDVDAKFLSNVLYSLAILQDIRASDFGDQLVQTVTEKKNCQPPTFLNNARIYSWGKSALSSFSYSSRVSNNSSAAEIVLGQRILSILEEMEQYVSVECQPNAITYTNAMVALKFNSASEEGILQGQTSNLEIAEQILERMEQSNDVSIQPNVVTYSALIQNYARSRLPNKASKAANILKRMKVISNVIPNTISYNNVLNACEYTDPINQTITEEAVIIACAVFDEIRNSQTSAQPNHVTYASFIGTLGTLMPPLSVAKHDALRLVFRKCCTDGFVSKLVLKKLRFSAGTDKRYQEFLLNKYTDTTIPTSWSRNVAKEVSKARDD
jgi:pentatricopeptide repeat protein